MLIAHIVFKSIDPDRPSHTGQYALPEATDDQIDEMLNLIATDPDASLRYRLAAEDFAAESWGLIRGSEIASIVITRGGAVVRTTSPSQDMPNEDGLEHGLLEAAESARRDRDHLADDRSQE